MCSKKPTKNQVSKNPQSFKEDETQQQFRKLTTHLELSKYASLILR